MSKANHQIRVSKEVFEKIQEQAKPITDTADDVLRRIFNLPAREKRTKQTDAGDNHDDAKQTD